MHGRPEELRRPRRHFSGLELPRLAPRLLLGRLFRQGRGDVNQAYESRKIMKGSHGHSVDLERRLHTVVTSTSHDVVGDDGGVSDKLKRGTSNGPCGKVTMTATLNFQAEQPEEPNCVTWAE